MNDSPVPDGRLQSLPAAGPGLPSAGLHAGRAPASLAGFDMARLVETVLDALPDYVYFKDLALRYLRVNPAQAALLGVGSVDEPIGKTDSDLLVHKIATFRRAAEQRVLDTGEPDVDRVEQVIHRDGRVQWLAATRIPLTDDSGTVVGLFGIAHDVTAARETQEAVQRRAVQLQVAAEVSRAASSVLNLDELIWQVVDLIRDGFDLYYAGLFLVDAHGQWAELKAGTGAAGREMLGKHHRLPVGGQSMIGWCIANAQPRIALDTGADAVRFDNPALPHTRSELALPLISRGQVIGALTIQSAEPSAFTEADVTSLTTMADQLANAIENARLFEERERQIADLAIVNDIGREISATLDLDTLFETVHRELGRLFDTTTFYIATYQEGDDEWESAFHVERGERRAKARYSLGAGLTGHVLRTRQPFLLNSREEVLDFAAARGLSIIGDPPVSWLAVPLIAADRCMGVMCVQSHDRANEYGERDLALLTMIAGQVAAAADNARLLAATRRRARELGVLNEMARILTKMLDIDAVVENIHRFTAQLVDATNLYVALYDAEKDEISFPLYIDGEAVRRNLGGRRAGKGMTEHVIRSRRPLLIKDNLPAVQAELDIESIGQAAESWLGVPMMFGEQPIGVITVQSYTTPRAYDESDRDVMFAIASQTAIAIQNARLFEQRRKRSEELAALHRVSIALAVEQRDLHSVLDTIARQAMALLDSDGGGVWLWREQDGELELAVTFQVPGVDFAGRRLKPGEGLTGRAYAEKRLLVIDDYLAWSGHAATFADAPFHAALAAPMIWQNRCVGALVVTRSQPGRPYAADEQALAELLTGQATAFVQNAQLFADQQQTAGALRRRLDQLDCLSDVGLKMQAAPDIPELARWLARRIPAAMQHPHLCRAAVEYGGQVYGAPGAAALPRQMVHRLQARDTFVGRVTVAYEQDCDFLDEESALLGEVVRRFSAYVESQMLFDDLQAALRDTQALYDASRRLSAAADLQEIVAAIAEAITGPAINRAVVWFVENDEAGRPQAFTSAANWYSGTGAPPMPLGARFPLALFPATRLVLSRDAIFVHDVDQDERLDPLTRAAFQAQQARAFALVPMWIGDRQLGTFMLVSEHPYHFTDREIQPYRSLVGQTAIALENRRLFQEVQAALAQTAGLFRAGAELNAAQSYDDILTTLRAHTVLGGADRSVTIEMFDRPWLGDEIPEGLTVVARHTTLPPDLLSTWHPLRNTPLVRLLRAGGPTIIESATDLRLDEATRALYVERFGVLGALVVPLVVGGQWIGLVEALFSQPLHPAQADVDRLMSLAGQASTTIQTLRQLAQIQAALTEVEATHRRYLQSQWQSYLRRPETARSRGFVYDRTQAERQDEVLPAPDLWRPEIEQAVRGSAPDTAEGRTYVPHDGDGRQAGMAVPIVLRGQTIGVLGIEDPEGERVWSDADAALLQEVGQQLALALENARLFEESQRRAERERLITEITARIRSSTDIAGVLQTTATELGRALGTSRAVVRLTIEGSPGQE